MALVVGAFLAAVALAFVLWPLMGPRAGWSAPALNTSSAGADAAEAMIARARAAAKTCWNCNALCPEPDAAYCSTCGVYLPARCSHCEAPVKETAPRFCTSCGWELGS